MKGPICEFMDEYCRQNPVRAHMPGHKGQPFLGFEALDITEISGADSLYEAEGIIARSETEAGRLFGADSFYSTEGSSQCIRAMLRLSQLHALSLGRKPLIAAGRNAHRAFLTGAALLDLPVSWLYPDEGSASYLACPISAEVLDSTLETMEPKPTAVYLTSPDYLGNTLDLAALSRVAHRHGCLLLVDNAHGAYLRFLPESRHPMDLGADICCDSAHKTLPALTGAAYLHISKSAPELLRCEARQALALFGSTSPSYLILRSLDAVNGLLAGSYRDEFSCFLPRLERLRGKLSAAGWRLIGDEPMKLSLLCPPVGYSGIELADALEGVGIYCEFRDRDHLVLMLSPSTNERELERIEKAFLSLPQKPALEYKPPVFSPCQSRLSIREAMLAPAEEMPVSAALGRVLASPAVSCPPAVPIVMCGEVIDEHAVECFEYYGVQSCRVVL